MMVAERWSRLWSLFDSALSRPPEGRSRWLRDACGADVALRAEVKSLLAAHGRADRSEAFETDPGWWRREAPPTDHPAPIEGRRVGRYTVGRVVGRGTSATVHEAWQDNPRRRVALKILRADCADEPAMRRAEFEADILARLHHPAVAKVYEWGRFDLFGLAQPFLAMEFVQGPPLTEHAAKAGLDRHARIGLLITLCDAVHHVHQRGIVHRDLKPSNILVDEQGDLPQLKVVDFGIALPAAQHLGATLSRSPAELAGTLPYMSPERLRGDGSRMDVPCDVYSLGVVSYELLCGSMPFRSRSGSVIEVVERIARGEPDRLGSHGPGLGGDLEVIVHTAMAQDPARRYPTALDLANDLRRLVANQPIAARTPTWPYVLGRFAVRHRSLVGATVFAAVVLIAGTILSSWMAVRAMRAQASAAERFEHLRALTKRLIFDFDGAVATLPGSTPVRRKLVTGGIDFLAILERDAPDDPALLMDLAGGYEALADVQGHPRTPNLGDVAGALTTLDRAMALRERLAMLKPGSASQIRLASCRIRLSTTLARLGRIDEALRHQHAIRSTMLSLGRSDCEDFAAMRHFFGASEAIASIRAEHEGPGRHADRSAFVEASWREGLATWRRAPVSAHACRDAGVGLMLGALMFATVDRPELALDGLDRAEPVLADAAVRLPDELDPTLDCADLDRHRGVLLGRLGEWGSAADAFRRSLARYEAASLRFPRESRVDHIAISTHMLVVDASARAGDCTATEHAERVVERVERWLADDPANVLRRQLAMHMLEEAGAVAMRLACDTACGWEQRGSLLRRARGWLARARDMAERSVADGTASTIERDAANRIRQRLEACDAACELESS